MRRSGKVVTPYSAVQETGENVPSCKHFWRCNELGVNNRVEDHIGGAHFRPNTPAIFSAGDGFIHPTNGGSTNITVEAPFQSPGSKIFVIFGVWKDHEEVGVPEGDITGVLGAGFHCHPTEGTQQAGTADWELWRDNRSSSTYLWDGSAASIQDTQTTSGYSFKRYGVGLIFVPGGTSHSVILNADGTVVVDTAIDSSTLSTVGTFAQQIEPLGNGIAGINEWYGLAHFHFSSAPDNWLTAFKWMTSEWLAGRKYIYPGWVGVD